MKKLFTTLVLLVIGFAAFADDTELFKTSMLIEENLFKNQIMIQQSAAKLSGSEKMMLYNRYSKDNAAVPFVVNLILGAGIGSFIQGDVSGGLLGLGGEVAGWVLYLNGMSSYYSSGTSTSASVGAILILATRIYELVRPFTYQSSYNKTLRNALGVYNLAFTTSPIISGDTVALSAAVTYSF